MVEKFVPQKIYFEKTKPQTDSDFLLKALVAAFVVGAVLEAISKIIPTGKDKPEKF